MLALASASQRALVLHFQECDQRDTDSSWQRAPVVQEWKDTRTVTWDTNVGSSGGAQRAAWEG